ncbi:MAG: hypothetical protein JXB04_03925 [Kiritimatiellae bacterium]|nr:hypothetical protein [Kiritimatiellia bacterium]
MKDRRNKEGIALIIVLGFLGILLLLAVTMMTTLRTERLTAQVAMNETQGRQLLRGAVAAAMDDVSLWLTEDATKPATTLIPMNIAPCRYYAIIASETPSELGFTPDPLSTNLNLLDGEATNWIPRKYLFDKTPKSPFNGTEKALEAEWIPFEDPVTKRILGRFAYLSFDCTGLLDINVVTNKVPRHEGKEMREVDVSALPEVVSLPNLVANRTFFHRIATFPEILFLNDETLSLGGHEEKQALIPADVDSFVPFSYCYERGWWDWDNRQWQGFGTNYNDSGANAPGNINEWSRSDAGNVLVKYFGESDADKLGDCFLDYTDQDREPKNPETSFSTEAVPMINELAVRSQIFNPGAGANFVVSIFVTVETWYPFPGNPGLSGYSLAEPPVTTPLAGNGIGVVVLTQPGGLVMVPPAMASTPPGFAADYTANDGFATHEFRIDAQVALTAARIMVLVSLDRFEVMHSGRSVDVAGAFGLRDLMPPGVTYDTMPAAGQTIVSPRGDVGISVSDPRLNYRDSGYWVPTPQTLGTRNTQADGRGEDGFEGYDMYVRDGELDSVAELGFISLGKPWTTVSLFSDGGRKLLTRFRTHSTTQSFDVASPTNGFVNPNSMNEDVLKAMFRDVRLDVPNSVNTNVLEDESALNYIVQSKYDGMISVVEDENIPPDEKFDSGAGWVTVPALEAGGALSKAGYDNNQREAIIRNTYRLFNANQNLYTMIVVAQAINDQGYYGQHKEDGKNLWVGKDDTITAEKRAVALVWRDPFPNSEGRHEMFVRQFKYLEE